MGKTSKFVQYWEQIKFILILLMHQFPMLLIDISELCIFYLYSCKWMDASANSRKPGMEYDGTPER